MDCSELSNFLTANGGPWIGHSGDYFISESDEEAISKLFARLHCTCNVKLFLPYVNGLACPDYLFVCCQWINVVHSLALDHVLQDAVPATFERLRDLLKPEANIERYVVYNSEVPWLE